MKRHLLIAGPMGAGKSTLATRLAEHLRYACFLESAGENNPFLERFYSDMPRWGLHSQVFFMAEAIAQQQAIARLDMGAVQDRSVWEHLGIFATGLLEGGRMARDEFQLLERLAALGTAPLPNPDLMIYLPATTDLIVQRIRARGRDYEQEIDYEYLRSHCAAYERWVGSFSVCPVLRIDPADYDWRRDEDLATVATLVRDRLGQL